MSLFFIVLKDRNGDMFNSSFSTDHKRTWEKLVYTVLIHVMVANQCIVFNAVQVPLFSKGY